MTYDHFWKNVEWGYIPNFTKLRNHEVENVETCVVGWKFIVHNVEAIWVWKSWKMLRGGKNVPNMSRKKMTSHLWSVSTRTYDIFEKMLIEVIYPCSKCSGNEVENVEKCLVGVKIPMLNVKKKCWVGAKIPMFKMLRKYEVETLKQCVVGVNIPMFKKCSKCGGNKCWGNILVENVHKRLKMFKNMWWKEDNKTTMWQKSCRFKMKISKSYHSVFPNLTICPFLPPKSYTSLNFEQTIWP